jgi:hypothetical protein
MNAECRLPIGYGFTPSARRASPVSEGRIEGAAAGTPDPHWWAGLGFQKAIGLFRLA